MDRDTSRMGVSSAASKQVTYGIMCQARKGYSLWLFNSHKQKHRDATERCDD